jgi:tetratricopeptide (TPR) repeat protein
MRFLEFFRSRVNTPNEETQFLIPKGVTWNIEDIYALEAEGNYRDALERWNILLTPFKDPAIKGDPRYARLASHRVIWHNIGLCYRHLEMYNKAIEAYDQAIILAQEARDSGMLADIHNSLGVVYRHMGNIDEALRQNEIALHKAKLMFDIGRIVAIRDNIANCYGEQGLFDKAEKEENKAYGMLLSAPSKVSPIVHARVLGNLGYFNWRLGRNQDGIHFMEKSLAKAREIGDRQQEALVLEHLKMVR